MCFTVKRREVAYKAPELYGDILDIRARVKEFTPYRIVFAYSPHNQDGRIVIKAGTDLVRIWRDLRLPDLPAGVKAAPKKDRHGPLLYKRT